MSWFSDIEQRDTSADTCPAPGVTIERRRLLKTSALVAAAVSLWPHRMQAAWRSSRIGEPVEDAQARLDQLLDELSEQAARFYQADERREEPYLFQVAARLASLEQYANPFDENTRRDVQMRSLGRRSPLDDSPLGVAIFQIKFEAGAVIPYHDHLDYNGVILGIEGEVRGRNFDIVKDDEDTGEVILRETHDALIRRGSISTLSSTRDNIHDLRAGKKGARVLDVFTFLEPGATSRYLNVEEEPMDAEQRTFAAHWRHRPVKKEQSRNQDEKDG